MAKKKKELSFLENFNFFNITFRFERTGEFKELEERISKINLLKFDDIKFEYNIEKISIMEDIFPEMVISPNIMFVTKGFEVFLSKKKVSISYPTGLSKSRRHISFRGLTKARALPIYRFEEEKEKRKITFEDLNKVDLFLKMFLIPELLENKMPELKEISIIFSLNLEKKINIESINNVIESNLLKNKNINLESIDFEILENENRYFFTIDTSTKSILCSFIYSETKFSIFENKIEQLMIKNYEKFLDIMEELKL